MCSSGLSLAARSLMVGGRWSRKYMKLSQSPNTFFLNQNLSMTNALTIFLFRTTSQCFETVADQIGGILFEAQTSLGWAIFRSAQTSMRGAVIPNVSDPIHRPLNRLFWQGEITFGINSWPGAQSITMSALTASERTPLGTSSSGWDSLVSSSGSEGLKINPWGQPGAREQAVG